MITSLPQPRLFKYIENLPPKNESVQKKSSNSFPTSAQNIDCANLWEPPRQGGSNEICFWAKIRKLMYIPVNPSFTV